MLRLGTLSGHVDIRFYSHQQDSGMRRSYVLANLLDCFAGSTHGKGVPVASHVSSGIVPADISDQAYWVILATQSGLA